MESKGRIEEDYFLTYLKVSKVFIFRQKVVSHKMRPMERISGWFLIQEDSIIIGNLLFGNIFEGVEGILARGLIGIFVID